MKIIVEKDDRFYIQFDFNRKISSAVIKLPNVEYNNKYKRWEISKYYEGEVMEFAQRYGFETTSKISKRRIFDAPAEMPKLTQEIDLKLTPYDYQTEGIAYGLKHGSSINGDAPGLGKTGQSIATIVAKNLFPCLVICPASLKYNWEAEWKLWTDHKPAILTDSIKHTWEVFYRMGVYDVFIVNYESLSKYFVVSIDKSNEGLKAKDINFHPNINAFKSVIVDESHRVKDPSTLQSKLTFGITRGKFVQLLSGTPIQNKPVDLLSQLRIIDKLHYFGGVTAFREMCADEERWPEINTILRKHCFFRREKKDVLKDLPDKFRQKVFCDIENRDEYRTALIDLEYYLREWKQASDMQVSRSMKAKAMVQIGVLKDIAARGKLNDVMDYIDNVIETGEKMVLFIYLKEIAGILRKRYPDALFFTGEESHEQRDENIHHFQKCAVCDTRFERHDDSHEFIPSDKQLIFVNYKAGGVGITLTAASQVAFIEHPWNPATTDQCEDRCHRISQKNAVQVISFVARDTIEESIIDTIEEKREMANTCTGAIDDTEESVINSIFELMTK